MKSFPFCASPFALAFQPRRLPAAAWRSTRHGIVSYVHDGRRPRHPAAASGTNSSGTALSSDGVGRPMLDTKPAIDPEDAKIDK